MSRYYNEIQRKYILILVLFYALLQNEQLGSHWTDLHEIWYLSIFQKSVEKIKFLLKSDKNNGTVHEN
jgi:hypothetical protein